MNTDEFRTMIVPADIVSECRTMAATWEGGVGMFTVGLPIGSDSPTHYFSSGMIDQFPATCMPWDDYSSGEPVRHEGDVPALVEFINNAGGSATEEQINTIIARVDISNQPWEVAAARVLGGE